MADPLPPPLLSIARSRAEVSRRDVLRLFAAGAAAASAACLERPGDQDVLPYVANPPESQPGQALRYASALVLDGFATGVIVETHEGRPTRIDGNPAHPASLGGASAILQARIADLYDPQRAQAPVVSGMPSTWERLAALLDAAPPGDRWLVLPPQSSPTVAALLDVLRARGVRIVFHAALGRGAAYRGAQLAFGAPLEQQIDFRKADVVVMLDADPFAAMPMAPGWARAAASRRAPHAGMSQLWAVEPMPTPSGTFADRRLAAPAADVAPIAVAMRARLGGAGALPEGLCERALRRLDPVARAWAEAAADALAAHRGAGAIVVGDRQPPAVHALARSIEAACGNHAAGAPVSFTVPALVAPLPATTLADLVAAIDTGQVASVVLVDVNPVLTAPPALDVAAALARVPISIAIGPYADETARACTASGALSHELEAWGDARAWDGTASIQQPMMRPLYPTRSTIEVLARLAGDPRSARELVKATWAERGEAGWRAALASGVVADTAARAVAVVPVSAARAETIVAALEPLCAPLEPGELSIALAGSVIHDGRFGANPWLEELPHPITKQVWGNGALVSARTAAALGVDTGGVLRVHTDAGDAELPAVIVPGHADGAITIELGYGRAVPALPIADGIGVDAYPLSDGTRVLAGRALATGVRAPVHREQTYFDRQGRDVAPVADLADYLRAPDALTGHLRGPQPRLLPPRTWSGLQWAMTIDTSLCTSCGACVIACQAENNTPSVPAQLAGNGRTMRWLRIDSYVDGAGEYVHQPLPCQHCEDAPCEYVCPVEATVHSPDGLNEQIYNRCVGTRFCSNNCPYKVRRFNWFAFDVPVTTRALQHNPDVTVRSRGVMEKCTYCVQRIRRGEIDARVERRELRPGEVVTACQAACPTGAIQFGALQHPDTPMVKMRDEPRRYDLLHDLGTRPRTQYLARIRNRGAAP
jgi:molybdopterin-containing oxidoreductase family iron-sulfur binding subunit